MLHPRLSHLVRSGGPPPPPQPGAVRADVTRVRAGADLPPRWPGVSAREPSCATLVLDPSTPLATLCMVDLLLQCPFPGAMGDPSKSKYSVCGSGGGA